MPCYLPLIALIIVLATIKPKPAYFVKAFQLYKGVKKRGKASQSAVIVVFSCDLDFFFRL